MQKEDEIQEVGGIRVRSERLGFGSEELISCVSCSKNNPPNRLNCVYCGARLELPVEVAAGLQFRPSEIEDWEPGVNIVVVGGSVKADAIAAKFATAAQHLQEAAEAAAPFPLLRVRPDEAEEVTTRLDSAGVLTQKIADKTLDHLRPPVRLKGIGFNDATVALHLFNSDRSVSVDAADVKLIVVGAVFKSSSEATVKRKRKETKHVDEKFSASDHAVIDVYSGDDQGGFRILPHGFNFSCLGDAKSLLAVENMKVLKTRLKKSFPNALYDDTYTQKLAILDHVWPRTIANTSKGLQRVGMKVERSIGETVSNEEQFTRYSRMLRELI